MLSLGFCFSAAPFIKKLFPTVSQRVDFLRRHSGFFNTHPYFVSYILGASLRLEEQGLAKESEEVKLHLSRSLGAVGDSLFWRSLKPVSVIVGMLLALYNLTLALAVFLLLFNVLHFWVRIHGLVVGYREGFEIVKTLPLAIFHSIIKFLNNLGSFLCGLLIVGLLASPKTVGGLPEATAFICGLIFMFVFIKWKIPVPYALAILLMMAVAAGFIL